MIVKYESDEESSFRSLLQNLMNTKHPDHIFVLFLAQVDPETQKSWLIDCDRAIPLIEQVLSLLENDSHLIIFRISQENYRNNEYFVFQDHRLKLRCLPTLTHWQHDECLLHLNNIYCQNLILLEEIILEHLMC